MEDRSEFEASRLETKEIMATLCARLELLGGQLEKLPTKSDLWIWDAEWLVISGIGIASICFGAIRWIPGH